MSASERMIEMMLCRGFPFNCVEFWPQNGFAYSVSVHTHTLERCPAMLTEVCV